MSALVLNLSQRIRHVRDRVENGDKFECVVVLTGLNYRTDTDFPAIWSNALTDIAVESTSI